MGQFTIRVCSLVAFWVVPEQPLPSSSFSLRHEFTLYRLPNCMTTHMIHFWSFMNTYLMWPLHTTLHFWDDDSGPMILMEQYQIFYCPEGYLSLMIILLINHDLLSSSCNDCELSCFTKCFSCHVPKVFLIFPFELSQMPHDLPSLLY